MTAQDANVWRSVWKVDVVELGRRDRVVVGGLDIAGLEDPTVSFRAEVDKGLVRVVVHRDFAAPPALGQLQPNDAAAEVDALPRGAWPSSWSFPLPRHARFFTAREITRRRAT